jgi:hypothetical protein
VAAEPGQDVVACPAAQVVAHLVARQRVGTCAADRVLDQGGRVALVQQRVEDVAAGVLEVSEPRIEQRELRARRTDQPPGARSTDTPPA